MSSPIVSEEEVKKVAKLANLPLAEEEVSLFAHQFSSTIEVINKLNEVDTTNTQPTFQVTGLKNITREDEVAPERVLSQSVALSQAAKSHQGYFVVNRVIDNN